MNQDMQFLTYRKKKIVYKICHLNEFLILKSTIIGFSLITSRGPSSSSKDVFHRAKKNPLQSRERMSTLLFEMEKFARILVQTTCIGLGLDEFAK